MDIRTEIRQKRRALSEEDRLQYAYALSMRLLSNREICSYDKYLCYYPTAEEINPWEFYQAMLLDGKALYFPVTDMKHHKLHFYRVKSQYDFIPGAMKIYEPTSREEAFLDDDDLSVVSITPGLAFDKAGNRIGYGGGFYDRFFAEHKTVTRVGVAYDFQMLDAIHTEPWDVPMEHVIYASII